MELNPLSIAFSILPAGTHGFKIFWVIWSKIKTNFKHPFPQIFSNCLDPIIAEFGFKV